LAGGGKHKQNGNTRENAKKTLKKDFSFLASGLVFSKYICILFFSLSYPLVMMDFFSDADSFL